jgi:hypothetical protein
LGMSIEGIEGGQTGDGINRWHLFELDFVYTSSLACVHRYGFS